jgi:NADH:ubiquinone oxidoreductase subunit 6 (subunit J)
MNSNMVFNFICLIGVLLLFSIWVLFHIKGNFNKVWVCILIIYFIFIILLIRGNSFTSCVFGIIYVGAMSILFIVFLSYTGSEVEVSTRIMASGFSMVSVCMVCTICFTPLLVNSATEIYNSSSSNSGSIEEYTPTFFYHLYTSYYLIFMIMLLALLVGLITTLTIVGVSRWSKNNKK